MFLGDSITDGETLPLLVRQAVGLKYVNAGVASDTAADMRRRLERDVLPHRPGRVILSAGINDVLRKVTAEAYEAEVVGISDRLKREKIPMLLLTPTILGPKHAEAESRLAEYVAALRRLAKREGYAVAEVHDRMREARTAGKELLEPDQVHLSFEGYRVMAQAVLEGLGYTKVSVPETLHVEPLPGILRDWQVRAVPEKSPALDERSVEELRPDASWKSLILPQSEPQPNWWWDQERRRGFALGLEKLAGAGRRFQAVGNLESPEAREVVFSSGGQLESIWLNGKRLWKSESWTGWHPGKERLPARLAKGLNRVVLESGGSFFLSVTAPSAD